jgi:nitroreductase
MELKNALYGRRAVRSFTDAPVKTELLIRLIDAAIQAPSAVNAQPWHFTVIRSAPLLDRISAASKTHMLNAMNGSSEAPHGFREHLSSPEFQIFYHAPVLVLISAKGAGWQVEDASLAAQNLMLAAFGEGLGTCWIGFAQRWLETPEGKKAVELPADYVPVAPIIVGYPKDQAPPVPRHAPSIRWLD